MTALRRGPRLLVTAVVAVAAIVAGVLAVGRSGDDTVRVTALFADASPLVPGNKVQLYGVEVGQIREVTLEEGRARVEMDVEPSILPLHTDATAKIMPVSLLGERFVQLERGTDAAPAAAADAAIPVDRTSAAVDLDQLLNTLDDPTSAGLASLVATLGQGVDGQGDKVAEALAALTPAMGRTQDLAAILDEQNALIDHLVGQADRVTGAAAPPLDSLVESTRKTLGVVSRNREVLDQAIKELPSTVIALRQSLSSFAGAANVTGENLASLRPLTGDLAETSRELKGFTDAAQPALASLPEVLGELNGMIAEARPVVDSLGPAASDLHSAAGSVNTLAADLLPHQPGVASHLENLMTGVGNWAMATAGHDGISHYFSAVVIATPDTLGSAAAGLLPSGVLPENSFNPIPPDPNNPGARPGTGLPLEVPVIPRLDPVQEPGNTTPRAGVEQDAPPPGGSDGSATGLSPQQEDSMLGQLLGGGR